ncbi:VOC family protein [Acinetobacter faecalis]|uniref:VOC family protein n=1 Tax=Acinetobacter faecalis TaxID=2665161 RepID=UPI002A90CF7D|nr:VOC family protein [Acinetobacter faecalis]MDY6468615.1 VOC family protein [Acinetobacter faecalis]
MNRINLICLGVKDIKASLDFYKNIGFKTYETQANPTIVFFDNQGSKLELYPIEQLAKDINAENPPFINQGFSGITFACNTKSENEIDVILHRVEMHGGTIIKPAQKVFWGGYSGYFQDLDGYYWEVAYSADWKFDDHNMLIIE